MNEEAKDYTRYLICPYTGKMFLIHVLSTDTESICPICNITHSFQKRNKSMNDIELGKKNNAWVESW